MAVLHDLCSYHIWKPWRISEHNHIFHLQQHKQGKMVLVIQPEITIALLTDALFSDAGWGFGFGAA